MKKLTCIVLMFSMVLLAAAALAAPSTISFQNNSTAGETNHAVTCSIVGINDKPDKVNDTYGRINLSSLRTYALTKGGLANYSASLHTKGTEFRATCVKTATGETYQNVKVYFDRVSGKWIPIPNGQIKF